MNELLEKQSEIKNILPDSLKEGKAPADEIEQLRAQMQDMQMEIDILQETINVL